MSQEQLAERFVAVEMRVPSTVTRGPRRGQAEEEQGEGGGEETLMKVCIDAVRLVKSDVRRTKCEE